MSLLFLTADAYDEKHSSACTYPESEAEDDETGLETYLPGLALADGEVLDYDPSTYDMLHSLDVDWPCLSFDYLNTTPAAATQPTAAKPKKLKVSLFFFFFWRISTLEKRRQLT